MLPVSRGARVQSERSPSSLHENVSHSARFDIDAASHSASKYGLRDYIDLDKSESYVGSRRKGHDTATYDCRRVPSLPESFLVCSTSSTAHQRLPLATQVKTLAEEEFILRKWEEWNTRIGEQLALEGTVPSVLSGRDTPRNGSSHSVSQFSSKSASSVHPKSARGVSPFPRNDPKTSSRCSSMSRSPCGSVGSEVSPFRVSDRLTASAERRRYRSKSTKDSREILFRRALGLKDRVGAGVFSRTPLSLARRLATPARPLIATADQESEHAKHATAEEHSECEDDDKGRRRAIGQGLIAGDDEWTKEVKGLIDSKQGVSTSKWSPSTAVEGPEGHLRVLASQVRRDVRVSDSSKWCLPLADAQCIHCATDAVLNMYSERDHFDPHHEKCNDEISVNSRLIMETFSPESCIGVPLEKSGFKILFIDYHLIDDQISAYCVEVPLREDYDPHVLPDWNESRRRFAPSPLAKSQELL